MKLLVLAAVGALAAGVLYHEEISEYLSEVAENASDSTGGYASVDTVSQIGQSTNNMFGRVGNALDR